MERQDQLTTFLCSCSCCSHLVYSSPSSHLLPSSSPPPPPIAIPLQQHSVLRGVACVRALGFFFCVLSARCSRLRTILSILWWSASTLKKKRDDACTKEIDVRTFCDCCRWVKRALIDAFKGCFWPCRIVSFHQHHQHHHQEQQQDNDSLCREPSAPPPHSQCVNNWNQRRGRVAAAAARSGRGFFS